MYYAEDTFPTFEGFIQQQSGFVKFSWKSTQLWQYLRLTLIKQSFIVKHLFTLQRQYVSVTSWQVVLVAGVMVRLKASHPLWRSEFKSHWSQFTVFQQNGHIIAIQYKIRTSVAYIGILVISFMGRYCDTCGEQFKLDYRQFSEQFHIPLIGFFLFFLTLNNIKMSKNVAEWLYSNPGVPKTIKSYYLICT